MALLLESLKGHCPLVRSVLVCEKSNTPSQDPDRLPIAEPVTDVCRLKTFDLYTLSAEDIHFDTAFELSAVRSDWMHGFAVYFGIVFQGWEGACLQNRPEIRNEVF